MNLESLHPAWPLAGGALIGLAAAIYLLFNGRVAGISGLTAAATGLARNGAFGLGLLFLLGLWGGAALAAHWIRMPQLQLEAGLPMLLIAGLLVGFGTRLGSGCTSGHGVCGLARLSPRSMVATLVFMAVAGLTVYVTRQVWGGGA